MLLDQCFLCFVDWPSFPEFQINDKKKSQSINRPKSAFKLLFFLEALVEPILHRCDQSSRFSLDPVEESGGMYTFPKQVIRVAHLFWFHMAALTGKLREHQDCFGSDAQNSSSSCERSLMSSNCTFIEFADIYG